MQLGFVSTILAELELEEVFAVAAEFGFECVELMCWPVGKAERRYAGVTNIDVVGFDAAAAKRVQSMSQKHRVKISGLGYYPNALSPDADEARRAAEHLRLVIDASALLGVNLVNTFVGRDWNSTVEQSFARFTDVWSPLVEHSEKQGVRIAIENCPMLFTNDEWPGGKNLAVSPAIWRRMFEAIPNANFGLNFDPSHFVWQQMDYLKPLREFASRMFHIHAKDARIDHDRLNEVGILATPNQFHTPKLPGLGEVNWGQFFSVLTDACYAGPVCVEVEDRAYEKSLSLRKQALQQSAVYLRNYIPRTIA